VILHHDCLFLFFRKNATKNAPALMNGDFKCAENKNTSKKLKPSLKEEKIRGIFLIQRIGFLF
jgi:hypothetical protein